MGINEMEPFFESFWSAAGHPDVGRIQDATWDSPIGTNWSSS